MTRAHFTRKLLAGLVATAALLAAASPAIAAEDAGGFAIAPMIFDVDVAPGRASTFQITITNADATPTRYTFSKEDFEGDRDEPAATPVLLGGKFDSAISGYDWIGAPAAITIPGGEARTVPVRVTPPANATGGHYASLIVSGGSRRAEGITATSRIGVLFMMNAGGVPPPEIVITEVTTVGETTTRTVVEYTNPSKRTHVTPRNPVKTVTDPVFGGEEKIKGECSTALPGGSGTCEFIDEDPEGNVAGSAGGLDSGFRSADIGLDGDETSAKGNLPTEWAGTWTSMLLPLVGIALFALYFLFLRRRRKDEEDDTVLPVT